jgi:hypothetical protein
MSRSKLLADKLRGIRVMLEELAFAANDRFNDLEGLNAGVARLAKLDDPTVSRLGTIGEYLAGDGAAEISFKLNEIAERIDVAIAMAKGGSK